MDNSDRVNSDKENINILLIDDDEDEYVIARDLFAEIGNNYVVTWISDFQTALDEIAKDVYDICLCDYNMGEYNGIQFIKQAVSGNYNTPIILLTGQGDQHVDIEAMKAGAVDYLDKNNLDADNLGRAIRYALEREKSEQKIRFLAYYDQLTDLPNRTLFFDRVHSAYASAKRYNRLFAIMFLDIDNFKRINDSLGHSYGDLLIKQVAQRLMKCIRREDAITGGSLNSALDTVARLGGDEFTILLSEIKEAENVSKIAERIREELAAPIVMEDKMINVTTSIGIAVYPNDGDDVDTLIKNADIAMYNAKSLGKNSFQYYDNSMNTAANVKLNLENELHKALDNNEFTMHYQPLVEIDSGKTFAVEALIRWHHPERGIVLPSFFIDIAEETGLIANLREPLFEIIGDHYRNWKSNGISDVKIAVNISPRQLIQNNFPDAVNRFIKNSGISPANLIFEITENSIFQNTDVSVQMLKSLSDLGIKISLDDFGSGYSSFNILKIVELDILKIDSSFIVKIPKDEKNSTIVSSLISIGHSRNLKVVAEGVETEEQLIFLESIGCDIAQGFYFSVPVPADEITGFLRDSHN